MTGPCTSPWPTWPPPPSSNWPATASRYRRPLPRRFHPLERPLILPGRRHAAPAENDTRPGQKILQPGAGGGLYLTATIGPHLVALPPQVRQRRVGMPTSRGRNRSRRSRERPAPSCRDRPAAGGDPGPNARARLQQGWKFRDPLLNVSFPALAREAGAGRTAGPSRRGTATDRAGTGPRRHRQAVGPPGGTRVPRRRRGHRRIDPAAGRRDIRDLACYAHTACLLLTAALTGMRENELMELRLGCRTTSQHGDGMIRYYGSASSSGCKERRWRTEGGG